MAIRSLFYTHDKLQAKGGTYSYDVVNTTFKGKLKKLHSCNNQCKLQYKLV